MQVMVAGMVTSLAVAALAMAVAWQHNPQGEIHGPDGVAWGFWCAVGLSWAVPVLLLTGVVAAMVGLVGRRRQSSNTR